MNDDEYPTDHHHHLLHNHGISENTYYDIRCLIVCVESVYPAMHAVDGLSLHCANYQHASQKSLLS